MKKKSILLLAASSLLILSGCGGNTSSSPISSSTPSSSSVTSSEKEIYTINRIKITANNLLIKFTVTDKVGEEKGEAKESVRYKIGDNYFKEAISENFCVYYKKNGDEYDVYKADKLAAEITSVEDWVKDSVQQDAKTAEGSIDLMPSGFTDTYYKGVGTTRTSFTIDGVKEMRIVDLYYSTVDEVQCMNWYVGNDFELPITAVSSYEGSHISEIDHNVTKFPTDILPA